MLEVGGAAVLLYSVGTGGIDTMSNPQQSNCETPVEEKEQPCLAPGTWYVILLDSQTCTHNIYRYTGSQEQSVFSMFD